MEQLESEEKHNPVDFIVPNKIYKAFKIIKSNNVLNYLFTFLNLSNAKVLLNVNQRFRRHLLKNDSHYLREIGYFTYGLSNLFI